MANRRTTATLLIGLAATVGAPIMPLTTARAIIVFDPTNYAQNLLQAARALQQINQQIQSLQNQATMITGMTRNLDPLSFSALGTMTGALQQISSLMGQAQGVSFRLQQTEQRFQSLFPASVVSAGSNDGVRAAQDRLQTVMASFHDTLTLQSQIVTNVDADAITLSDLVSQSQDAHGNLQAQQASNQLTALAAKQQMQLQTLLAAQYRADALDRATQAQDKIDAQAATRRFLGTGQAYTPQ